MQACQAMRSPITTKNKRRGRGKGRRKYNKLNIKKNVTEIPETPGETGISQKTNTTNKEKPPTRTARVKLRKHRPSNSATSNNKSEYKSNDNVNLNGKRLLQDTKKHEQRRDRENAETEREKSAFIEPTTKKQRYVDQLQDTIRKENTKVLRSLVLASFKSNELNLFGRLYRSLGLGFVPKKCFGLVSSQIRKQAWPLLVYTKVVRWDKKQMDSVCRDIDQVVLDVKRTKPDISNKTFGDPYAKEMYTLKKQDQLGKIISSILIKNKELHYYQGFHQICNTLMSLTDSSSEAVELGTMIAFLHTRDAMYKDFELVTRQLNLIFSLLKMYNKRLFDFFNEAEIPTFFAISWVLTFFSHDVKDREVIHTIFDFVLASHPAAILYLSFSLLDFHSDMITRSEKEFSTIHSVLMSLPQRTQYSEWIQIVSMAEWRMRQFLPEKLVKLSSASLPPWSCLVTFDKSRQILERGVFTIDSAKFIKQSNCFATVEQQMSLNPLPMDEGGTAASAEKSGLRFGKPKHWTSQFGAHSNHVLFTALFVGAVSAAVYYYLNTYSATDGGGGSDSEYFAVGAPSLVFRYYNKLTNFVIN